MEMYFVAMEIIIPMEKDLVKLIITVIIMISGRGQNKHLPIIKISMFKLTALRGTPPLSLQ